MTRFTRVRVWTASILIRWAMRIVDASTYHEYESIVVTFRRRHDDPERQS